ncbi:MAG: hypothetical protein U9Q40_03115 [Campylobacterota bacterium]|nr:hypothetical protein [Campylobacterota bacterium]
MASITEIQNSVAKAKCCFGSLTCNTGRLAKNGMSYRNNLLGLKGLRLYIFALEQYLIDLESVSYTSIDIMLSYINNICNTCYDESGGGTSIEGEHTTFGHTESDHTK